jgi:hypothetical protein
MLFRGQGTKIDQDWRLCQFSFLTNSGIATRIPETWPPVCVAFAFHYTRRPLVDAEAWEFNGSSETFAGSETVSTVIL